MIGSVCYLYDIWLKFSIIKYDLSIGPFYSCLIWNGLVWIAETNSGYNVFNYKVHWSICYSSEPGRVRFGSAAVADAHCGGFNLVKISSVFD
jgi:hypothetical protein